jgi:DNA-binding HxlR family transcriptional regulator
MGRRTYAEERQIQDVILKLLQPYQQGVRWSEVKTQARRKRLSPNTLSSYLKTAVNEGVVERNVDATAHPPVVLYRLTSAGRVWLETDPVLRRLRAGAVVREYHKIAVDQIKETAGLVTQRLPGPAHVESYLFIDRKHAPIAGDIVKHLNVELLASLFMHPVYRALYKIERGDKPPATTRSEELSCLSKALDADVAVMIRFDTSRYASNIDWETEIRKAEEDHRNCQRAIANLRVAAQTRRREIVASFARALLEEERPVEENIEAVIQWWKMAEFPKPPTREEVEAIIQDWVGQGLLEIEEDIQRYPRLTEKGAQSQRDHMESIEGERVRQAVETIHENMHGPYGPWQPKVADYS